MDDLKNIIESLLFVADEPLNVERLKKIIPQTDTQEIRQALSDLASEYDSRQTSFHLDEVAGGYQLRTRPAYTEWIRRLIQPKPARLSRAALETLAIIAYKQPVIRADIEHVRGVDSGGILRMLMERKLIRILGRKEIPGRPLIYATTKLFLEIFGLKDLKELPSPQEIEALGADENNDLEGQKYKRGATEELPPSQLAVVEDPPSKSKPETESPERRPDPSSLASDSADSAPEKELDPNPVEDYKQNEDSETGG